MKVIAQRQLDVAARALETGELVVVPTRRWYMICGDAASGDVCGRIYAGKQRPTGKSLAYIIRSQELAAELFAIKGYAQRLIDAFWPSDLALVLPWRETRIGHRHSSVGTPNALVVQEIGILGDLARLTSVPLAATTANISGEAGVSGPGPAITVDEVRNFVEKSGLEVTICVDGGICPAVHHLTIVDCTDNRARLIRPGLVHERAIATALNQDLL